MSTRPLVVLALGLATALVADAACAQILDETGRGQSPTPAAAPSAAPPAPAGETLDETGAAARPGVEFDERSAAGNLREPFCTSCVVLGVAAGLAVATIPLAALAEKASRTKDDLDRWVKLQPDGDLGFVVGYGFAKADKDQERFTISAAVMGGLTGAALITGVVLLFTQEREHARMVGDVELTPAVGADGGGLWLRGAF